MHARRIRAAAWGWAGAWSLALAGGTLAQPTFVDATARLGLPDIDATRVTLADLDSDGRPDLIVRVVRGGEGGKTDLYRVFMNRENPGAPLTRRLVELGRPSGLPHPRAGDCLVFADLDNDGRADAIFTRYLDLNAKGYAEPEGPRRTCVLRGRGDGTFAPPVEIEAAKRATTACIAVGDVNSDGRLDLWLGNWYVRYGESNEAYTSDLLVQDAPESIRPAELGQWQFRRRGLPEDAAAFDEEADAAGRPMYGAMMVRLPWSAGMGPDDDGRGVWATHLLSLNYGRRANRLWSPVGQSCGAGLAPEACWTDAAPALGLDGDAIRHGRYPDWLKARAKTDARFDRADEKPYRSHGNTFDAAIGDIDNDGDFDLFFAEITHAWAGESSDRSRFLVLEGDGGGRPGFVAPARLSVDRAPADPPREEWTRPPLGSIEKPWVPRWNQGDLFCELADLDHDGRLDLILCSSDYPDPAPLDQRLRIFWQQADGTLKDATSQSGIDHAGAQQVSIGDIDGDGDLDLVVGQSYNRMPPELVEATNQRQGSQGPRMRVFLNQEVERRAAAGRGPGSVVLKLIGADAEGPAGVSRCNRDALGAVVKVTATVNGREVTQMRQLVGIGGCGGKQHEFIVHVGLGDAERAERVEVMWPAPGGGATVMKGVEAGRREVRRKERE
ncbi:MAG: VCBS repeat-containing protein [Phycisphaerae bacterium]|nr:VCBS repeat-containing protein [Phycisphaerae bacterium]